MSAAPFVTQLRARRDTIRLGTPDEKTITIRVEMPEVWDTVRIAVPGSAKVDVVKVRALEALFPQAQYHEDFVVKLRGWEVLNEHETLADAGVTDGAILLLTHRLRRALR
ncbi:MAG: EsaB/YukD family protein [Gemmatimonadaceae bacterium]|nr:EsaB/YukD family protein [Gemmatimonadaceae bacterium]